VHKQTRCESGVGDGSSRQEQGQGLHSMAQAADLLLQQELVPILYVLFVLLSCQAEILIYAKERYVVFRSDILKAGRSDYSRYV